MTSPHDLTAADTTKAPPRLGLTEGMILAAIPFAGYLLAFAYESGYVARFGVPIWLIRIELTHVFIISALIGTAYMLWLGTVSALPDRRWKPLLAHLIAPIGWVGVAYLFAMRAAGTTGGPATIAIALVVASLAFAAGSFILGIILPIVRFKDIDSWLDRLQRQVNRDVEAMRHTALEGMLARDPTGRLFSRMSALYLIVVVAPALCYFLGTYNAFTQMRFLLVKSVPCVAIRQYGDATICVGVDTLQRRLQPWVRRLPSSSDSLTYELRFLGFLRPSPYKPSIPRNQDLSAVPAIADDLPRNASKLCSEPKR